MKKTYFLAAFAAAAALSFAACGNKAPETSAAAGSQTAAAAEAERATETAPVYDLVSATTGGAWDKVPDPTTPEVAVISLYVPKEDGSGLMQEMDSIDALDAGAVMEKLIALNAVEAGVKVLGLEIKDDTGILDLSGMSAIDDRTRIAIGNTYLTNFELNHLEIRIDGKTVEGCEDLLYDSDYKTAK